MVRSLIAIIRAGALLAVLPLVAACSGVNGVPVTGTVTFDGQFGCPLTPADTVIVTRSPRSLRLVRAPNRDFFAVLRTKLKWGESTARRR